MYHNQFRITLLVTAVAMILAACGAPIPTSVPATEQTTVSQALTKSPTATEISSTNTLEPTATQVVLLEYNRKGRGGVS